MPAGHEHDVFVVVLALSPGFVSVFLSVAEGTQHNVLYEENPVGCFRTWERLGEGREFAVRSKSTLMRYNKYQKSNDEQEPPQEPGGDRLYHEIKS